ncbi:hypothetical protein THAOC_21200, partial [Thalassiosira oceanica]
TIPLGYEVLHHPEKDSILAMKRVPASLYLIASSKKLPLARGGKLQQAQIRVSYCHRCQQIGDRLAKRGKRCGGSKAKLQGERKRREGSTGPSDLRLAPGRWAARGERSERTALKRRVTTQNHNGVGSQEEGRTTPTRHSPASASPPPFQGWFKGGGRRGQHGLSEDYARASAEV